MKVENNSKDIPVNESYAVQMRGITKTFGNFYAIDNISMDVKKGTIHALLGENGAGKSTLMNILYGFYQADKGEIYLRGKKVDIKNPNIAIEHGIGMVHQHFMLVDNFTVTQNIVLGKEVTNKLGIINTKKAKKEVMNIVEQYGLKVDPDEKIENISVGMQQRVEILKALYRGADLLIFDEPTAILTPQEVDEFINIMCNLIKNGKTILLITHKLKEIKLSSDVCTIIRKGKYVDTVNVDDVEKNELANMMVGRSVKLSVEKKPASPEEVIFEVDRLVVENDKKIEVVKNLNLKIRKGEIFGIAGIDGNGQKELIEAISNLSGAKKGAIKINGKNIENTNPKTVINSKIAIVHDDRHKRGSVVDFTVAENMVIEKYRSKPYSKKYILNWKLIKKFTNKLISEYDVRPENCADRIFRDLSGGNQQKVVIAREISNDPDLLIFVQPTRGLDVGAVEYVHRMLIEERDKGKAILLISFELDEIMNLSDTIGVIYDGTIMDVFKQGEVDEKILGFLMAGGRKSAINM